MNSPPNTPERSRTVDALRIVFWLIQAIWLCAALSLGMSTARAEAPCAPDTGEPNAMIKQAADVCP